MGVRTSGGIAVVVAAAALGACNVVGCERDGGERPLEPGPMPAHVVAVATLPSLEVALHGVSSFGELVRIGEAQRFAVTIPARLAALTGSFARNGLDGYDRRRPVHLVVLHAAGGEPSYVLVVGVGDRTRLTESARGAAIRVHRDAAAIGRREAVELVAPWVLHELVARPPPARATLRVYPAAWLAAQAPSDLDRYARAFAELAADGDPDILAAAGALRDVAVGAFRQADVVELAVTASDAGLDLDLAWTPRAGTALAAFAAAQRPSRFALLARVPPVTGMLHLAGDAAPGPFAADVRAGARAMLDAFEGLAFAASEADLAVALLDAATGEVAYVQSGAPDDPDRALVFAVDPAAAAPVAAHLATPAGARAVPGRARALDGDTMAVTTGPNAAAHLAHLRTAAAPPLRSLAAPTAVIVDDAQARGDSFVGILDLAALLPADRWAADPANGAAPARGDGTWVALGAADRRLHVRFGMSAGQVRAGRLLAMHGRMAEAWGLE